MICLITHKNKFISSRIILPLGMWRRAIWWIFTYSSGQSAAHTVCRYVETTGWSDALINVCQDRRQHLVTFQKMALLVATTMRTANPAFYIYLPIFFCVMLTFSCTMIFDIPAEEKCHTVICPWHERRTTLYRSEITAKKQICRRSFVRKWQLVTKNRSLIICGRLCVSKS